LRQEELKEIPDDDDEELPEVDDEEDPSQNDVDLLINEITKERRPMKRKSLKNKTKMPAHAMLDNHPPKRLGTTNTQSFYPMINVTNGEQ